MRNRTVRVPDHLWQAAMKKAKEEKIDLSEVIRLLLQAYVDGTLSVQQIVKLNK